MKDISEGILTELGWDEAFHIPEANAENKALIEEVSATKALNDSSNYA